MKTDLLIHKWLKMKENQRNDKSEQLPDLMTAMGSPPWMLALLIEGDVISVQ